MRRATPGRIAATETRGSGFDQALEADIIVFAVQFLNFKDVGSAKPDWTGKIVVDVTNAAFLLQEVQDKELHARLSSEVNAERVPGAKLVKAFNQLPMKVLSSPVPAGGKRVVFVSSDHEDASAKVAGLAGELGFAPIEVGRSDEGGRLIQARNALVFQDLIKYGQRSAKSACRLAIASYGFAGLSFRRFGDGAGEIHSGQAEDRSTSSTLRLSSSSVNGFTSR
jgi:8-hydroxy-5-deazaflavin:NADPH oxidoreductase